MELYPHIQPRILIKYFCLTEICLSDFLYHFVFPNKLLPKSQDDVNFESRLLCYVGSGNKSMKRLLKWKIICNNHWLNKQEKIVPFTKMKTTIFS